MKSALKQVKTTGVESISRVTQQAKGKVLTAVRQTIARNVETLLGRGDVAVVVDAMVAMYAGSLQALCTTTRYTDAGRIAAGRILPVLAGRVLVAELKSSGQVPTPEYQVLQRAVGLIAYRRGAGGWPEPALGESQEVSNLGLALASRFDQVAAKTLFSWSAHPPSPADALTIEQVNLVFGIRPVLSREELIEARLTAWDAFKRRQREAGRPVSDELFAKRAHTTRSSFNRNWLGGVWPDNSKEGARILLALTDPVEVWPQA